MVLLGGLKDAAVENWGMVVISLAVVAALIVLAFVAERVLKTEKDDVQSKESCNCGYVLSYLSSAYVV